MFKKLIYIGGTMEFKRLKELFQQHVTNTIKEQDYLFVVDTGNEVWETYLNSFPQGTNEVFRERQAFDCSCCKAFIRQFANVVAIKNNKVVTMWDFETCDDTYQPVIDVLSKLVKKSKIKDVFITKQANFGTDYNHEQLDNGDVHKWHHFYIKLPKRFVINSQKSEASLMGEFRDARNVFERSLEEISREAIETILDLIAENTLYKGEEWQGVLVQFLKSHDEYHDLPDNEKANYCWFTSTQISGAVSKIRNHSIGVLLQDISNGIDITKAVERYEIIVAPQNYKRPKAIFTKKMVEDAEEVIVSLGLVNSLGRRHAIIEDITINNVEWANKDAAKAMRGLGIFEVLKQEVAVDPKKFNKVKGVGIDHFIENILPAAKDIQVLLENRHQSNLVSLTAPKIKDSSTLFKWSNGFAWAYNYNITDSMMKQRVKIDGGDVYGFLRFSMQYNDTEPNFNDFDAHCTEPDGNHIYFGNKGITHHSSGKLDVDIINPVPGKAAVENITWSDKNKIQEGPHCLSVKNYSHRGGRSGFDAEIEFDGQLYEYSYNKELANKEEVQVAKLYFSKKDGIKFLESLPSSTSSKTVWGLNTNQFHPVSVCTYSPNYWDEQHGIGHKHIFFMLVGANNDTSPNGFFNEYLREDFMKYKKVFAALGNKMKVAQSDNQLSGLGFSSTKRNNLIAKVDNKIMKIIF